MKKIIVFCIAFMMMCGVSSAATVAENCGCGLGKVLIGSHEGFIWNMSGTSSNGTCGNQTCGMTSGTSGCDSGGKLVMNEQIKLFVADNMDNLAVDMAAGEGESLEALAQIAQVSVEDQPVFFGALQNNFERIYSSVEVNHHKIAGDISTILETI